MNWAEFVEEFLPQPRTILVEALDGASGYGDLYTAPVTVEDCYVDHTRRWVKVQTGDAAGAQRLSSTTVLAPPGTVAPAGSRVTLPSGVVSTVITSSLLDAHGHDLPEHVEISLE